MSSLEKEVAVCRELEFRHINPFIRPDLAVESLRRNNVVMRDLQPELHRVFDRLWWNAELDRAARVRLHEVAAPREQIVACARK